jgi:hypothetical protein
VLSARAHAARSARELPAKIPHPSPRSEKFGRAQVVPAPTRAPFDDVHDESHGRRPPRAEWRRSEQNRGRSGAPGADLGRRRRRREVWRTGRRGRHVRSRGLWCVRPRCACGVARGARAAYCGVAERAVRRTSAQSPRRASSKATPREAAHGKAKQGIISGWRAHKAAQHARRRQTPTLGQSVVSACSAWTLMVCWPASPRLRPHNT